MPRSFLPALLARDGQTHRPGRLDAQPDAVIARVVEALDILVEDGRVLGSLDEVAVEIEPLARAVARCHVGPPAEIQPDVPEEPRQAVAARDVAAELVFRVAVDDEDLFDGQEDGGVGGLPLDAPVVAEMGERQAGRAALRAEPADERPGLEILRVEAADVGRGLEPAESADEEIPADLDPGHAAEKGTDAGRVVEIHLSDREIEERAGLVIGQAGVVEDDLVRRLVADADPVPGVDGQGPALAGPTDQVELEPGRDLVEERAVREARAVPVEVDPSRTGRRRERGTARRGASRRGRRPRPGRSRLSGPRASRPFSDRGPAHRPAVLGVTGQAIFLPARMGRDVAAAAARDLEKVGPTHASAGRSSPPYGRRRNAWS